LKLQYYDPAFGEYLNIAEFSIYMHFDPGNNSLRKGGNRFDYAREFFEFLYYYILPKVSFDQIVMLTGKSVPVLYLNEKNAVFLKTNQDLYTLNCF
jgi:hypothetical protein